MSERVIEGNKLIAKFLKLKGRWQSVGLAESTFFYKGAVPNSPQLFTNVLEYHSSWDWLMPVWKKLFRELLTSKFLYVEIANMFGDKEPAATHWYNKMEQPIVKVLIEPAWATLVEAITWYNSFHNTLNQPK